MERTDVYPKLAHPVTARGVDPRDIIREAIRKKLRARATVPTMSDAKEGSLGDRTPGDPLEDRGRPPGMK